LGPVVIPVSVVVSPPKIIVTSSVGPSVVLVGSALRVLRRSCHVLDFLASIFLVSFGVLKPEINVSQRFFNMVHGLRFGRHWLSRPGILCRPSSKLIFVTTFSEVTIVACGRRNRHGFGLWSWFFPFDN
jgi:hypothetical protein